MQTCKYRVKETQAGDGCFRETFLSSYVAVPTLCILIQFAYICKWVLSSANAY